MTTSFETLSIADKRRAIAADAAAQIRADKLRPRTGAFIRLIGSYSREELLQSNMTLRDAVTDAYTAKGFCEACALGAIMIGQLNINGDCPIKNIAIDQMYGQDNGAYVGVTDPDQDGSSYTVTGESLSPFITRYFSASQLILIEIAFEKGYGCFDCARCVDGWNEGASYAKDNYEQWARYQRVEDVPYEMASDAVAFGQCFQNDQDRALAIMDAIAANPEGRFCPDVLVAS